LKALACHAGSVTTIPEGRHLRCVLRTKCWCPTYGGFPSQYITPSTWVVSTHCWRNIAIALTTPESARHWAVRRQLGSYLWSISSGKLDRCCEIRLSLPISNCDTLPAKRPSKSRSPTESLRRMRVALVKKAAGGFEAANLTGKTAAMPRGGQNACRVICATVPDRDATKPEGERGRQDPDARNNPNGLPIGVGRPCKRRIGSKDEAQMEKLSKLFLLLVLPTASGICPGSQSEL